MSANQWLLASRLACCLELHRALRFQEEHGNGANILLIRLLEDSLHPLPSVACAFSKFLPVSSSTDRCTR